MPFFFFFFFFLGGGFFSDEACGLLLDSTCGGVYRYTPLVSSPLFSTAHLCPILFLCATKQTVCSRTLRQCGRPLPRLTRHWITLCGIAFDARDCSGLQAPFCGTSFTAEVPVDVEEIDCDLVVRLTD
ncbi:hypothetical protein J3R82DRAFT_11123 [Butyriboletus roseoflavus]|nr:hypothetical protein J3R82DRAFT_11123 [Butyriboletus roseoflavus]